MADQQHDSRHHATRPPSADDIARRAYELFQARGGEPGHDLEHWLEAEHELSRTAPSDVHDQGRYRRDRDR
jgi:hypothetical protein